MYCMHYLVDITFPSRATEMFAIRGCNLGLQLEGANRGLQIEVTMEGCNLGVAIVFQPKRFVTDGASQLSDYSYPSTV